MSVVRLWLVISTYGQLGPFMTIYETPTPPQHSQQFQHSQISALNELT